MTGLGDAFQGVRRALEIAQVKFAIGGSWASTAYGEPRQTNDIDLITAFDRRNLDVFLKALGEVYYYDRDTAEQALMLGRSFNVIHQQLAFKFDFFPVHDEHGASELERRQYFLIATLDKEPVPVISAEDTIIAKLRWYRVGGEVSQQQWRDIVGIFRMEGANIDDSYLNTWTGRLGLDDLCRRARDEASQD